MLQTKLDDVIMENNDHREYINQLQDNNARLEATIAELTEKLEQCTRRLKEVEEANHKLGREALRRSESKSNVQPEGESNIAELKRHNKVLQVSYLDEALFLKLVALIFYISMRPQFVDTLFNVRLRSNNAPCGNH